MDRGTQRREETYKKWESVSTVGILLISFNPDLGHSPSFSAPYFGFLKN